MKIIIGKGLLMFGMYFVYYIFVNEFIQRYTEGISGKYVGIILTCIYVGACLIIW